MQELDSNRATALAVLGGVLSFALIVLGGLAIAIVSVLAHPALPYQVFGLAAGVSFAMFGLMISTRAMMPPLKMEAGHVVVRGALRSKRLPLSAVTGIVLSDLSSALPMEAIAVSVNDQAYTARSTVTLKGAASLRRRAVVWSRATGWPITDGFDQVIAEDSDTTEQQAFVATSSHYRRVRTGVGLTATTVVVTALALSGIALGWDVALIAWPTFLIIMAGVSATMIWARKT
jgi:hypothetical protein